MNFANTSSAPRDLVGPATDRKDGALKVAGAAKFASEFAPAQMLYGFLVTSKISSGRIKSIDTSSAAAAPGVVAVVTHLNAPKMYQPANDRTTNSLYEKRLPLSDDKIHYA